MKILRQLKSSKFFSLISFLIFLNLIIFIFAGVNWVKENNLNNIAHVKETKEVKEIKAVDNIRLKTELYKKLIERVGPVEAQEELYNSGIPFDGQSHLVNHTVGDWLYTKYPNDGLKFCKDYFLSSCYHGFLIRFIAAKGIDELDSVMQGCFKVGVTTATQCAHGIGHGLLAWEGYKNLPQALEDCDKVEKLSANFPIFNCYDGVFMENNWAVHNDGTPSPDRWVKDDDPTYPCYDARIKEKYRRGCWSNQPQVMYKLFQGDVSRVAKECKEIKAVQYQDTCFDSLARQINPAAEGDPERVFILCDKMPEGWKNQCIYSNVSAFFSVGDRELPFVLCEMIPENAEAACYDVLQQRLSSYVQDFKEKIKYCEKIPEEYRSIRYCPSST